MTFSRRLLLFINMLFLPGMASAHSPIKGIGDLLNGMIHPLLVPAQVLVIVALGLWFGQNQSAGRQKAVLLFLFASIAGLVTAGYVVSFDVATLLLLVAASLGLLVISDIELPQVIYLLTAVLAGFVVGMDSSPEGFAGQRKIIWLFGSGVGIYFMLLYAMALSESLSNRHWKRITVRVMASWLSASALMVLALGLSQNS